MLNDFGLTRRAFLGFSAALAGAAAMPGRLCALTVDGAERLVSGLVEELMVLINLGRPENRMFQEFEGLLDRYADMPIIAQSVLGPAWRTASATQRRNFTDVFGTYISRKYGRQFRDLIGGSIDVTGARAIRNFFEVTSVISLQGEAPYDLIWLVSDGSGQPRVFNLIVAGVNLRTTEAEEVGAILDRNRGNIDAMIDELRTMG
jgi:phospholipid transport system substrate-binding protein